LGCVDDIVPEPSGGAQEEASEAVVQLDQMLTTHLRELLDIPPEQLVAERLTKFRNIAQFYTS
jgi:acetyl-CoA carboxylase carboxyl transferase subunit alpha